MQWQCPGMYHKLTSLPWVPNCCMCVTLRWVRAAGKRLPVAAHLVIEMYQTHMGHVDRVDKNVALSRMRLKKCLKRYHRAIFVWYLAIVLNNIIVLFDASFVDVEELRKSKEKFGYKHWFQNSLGNCRHSYTHAVIHTTLAQSHAIYPHTHTACDM